MARSEKKTKERSGLPSSSAAPLLSLKEVAQRLSLSTSSVHRMMRAGEFPRPMRLGRGALRWRVETVDQFLAEREAAAGAAN